MDFLIRAATEAHADAVALDLGHDRPALTRQARAGRNTAL